MRPSNGRKTASAFAPPPLTPNRSPGCRGEGVFLRPCLTASLMLILCCSGVAQAQVQSFDLGPFGELTSWLVGYTPPAPLEKDPLEAVGGEAKFAAMSDPQLRPCGGRSLDLPGPKADEKTAVLWQIAKMVPPEYPNIWSRYPRLNVCLSKEGHGTGANAYLYCQLLSPQDLPASLIVGVRPSRGRFYLNGQDLGTIANLDEDARELPIQLRQGVNHLVVRIETGGSLSCRLVGAHAEPLRSVKVQFDAPHNAPVAPGIRARTDEPLAKLATQIPPLPPAEHPEGHGANLARTMALLEAGKFTHRPVRIVFYGQSIESGWPDLLVQSFRERYPGTTIVYDNRAIGGWFVWRLLRCLKHDVLRWHPDLVLFSAYQGTAEVWERLLSDLRRETTADIIIRTQHLGGRDDPGLPDDGAETVTLRRLARKYGIEFVELRSEWINYVKANKLDHHDLLADGVHLNRKGQTLLALLYERHFRDNAAHARPWADTVRRFDVMRCLEERQTDELLLTGGWTSHRGWAQSASPQDSLKLKFVGTRVDLVLPIGRGRATVLIDGKQPSELGLFHGTRPYGRTREHYHNLPCDLMTYHLGKRAQEETWALKFTHGTADQKHARFQLSGSQTGPDGEGDTDHDFASASGRIFIAADDWGRQSEQVPPNLPDKLDWQPLPEPKQLVWHILPDSLDTVPCDPTWRPDTDYYCGQPYTYVTVADGLRCGPHELTLKPMPVQDPSQPFVISGVDIHRPPLARDVSETTVP